MERKSKAKWFFIGLAVGWAPIFIAAIVILAWVNRPGHDDPFHGVRPDMGTSLHQFGRSSTWNATHMPLGATGFKAAAGPHRYTDEPDQDWDYYSIDVERPEGRSSYVFFQRDFRMDEIPKDLIHKNVQDIVTFDEPSRIVTFDLGTRKETYTLPRVPDKTLEDSVATAPHPQS
ncbi:MAG: hypothetical protein PHR35_07660 [Kiritimatiellae bacterium]|nr:hypothetical protein [Kiritimatiellia bacterium]